MITLVYRKSVKKIPPILVKIPLNLNLKFLLLLHEI